MEPLKFILTIVFSITANQFFGQKTQSQFADLIIEAKYSGSNAQFSTFYGGDISNYPHPISPDSILGNNTKYFLSLPEGSFVIVKFTDNLIVDSPNGADIFITEGGCSEEQAAVEVSENGVDFFPVGTVDDCKTSTIDLSKYNIKFPVQYLKITGLDAGGASPGFDLINIYGLPNANKSQFFKADSLNQVLKRKDPYQTKCIILNFESNRTTLSENELKNLETIITTLKKYPEVKITLTGHTDSDGSDEYNEKLALNRAKETKTLIVSKGLNENRISIKSKGELSPLKPNNSEENKRTNRRIEMEINFEQLRQMFLFRRQMSIFGVWKQ